jgi:tetratricopeptide (TPR) repeat protein
MTGRIVFLIIGLFAVGIHAQEAKSDKQSTNSQTVLPAASDDLIKHLTAAESHQVSGNLMSAAIENQAVLGTSLQRLGNIAIEEGRYADAVKILTECLKYADNATNRTTLAIAYMRQNEFEKALAEARTAVTIDPKHIGSHYVLGNIYYAKEDYKAALPELEMVFSEAPDFEIARALGLAYLNLKQLDRARLHFEKMRMSAGKENADLHILFAKFYERTNNHADAELELKRALSIEPNKLKLNFYLGYLLLQNGGTERMADAGAAFERELKLNPNDFYSWFFSGVVASSENDHQKAIPVLLKAVEINPSNGEAFLYLAQSQIEVNELAAAEKNLRRAIELEAKGGKNTQSRRTHFMLGRLLLRTGKKEEGQKELEIAGKLQQESLDSSRSELSRTLGTTGESSGLDPIGDKSVNSNVQVKLEPERIAQLKKLNTFLVDVTAQAFNNLGVIAAQSSRMEESLERFVSAGQWKPDFPGLDRNLGIIAFRTGQFDRAVTALSRVAKINPKDELARQMLGTSYYFTKDYRRAVETLKPIESALIGKPELAYFYGIALVRSDKSAEANAVFGRLAAAKQQDPEAHIYAAQGFMLVGDYERAIKEFTAIASAAPGMAKIHFFLGQSLIRANRFLEAEEAFRRAVEIDSSDESSKYHLAFTLIERKTNLEEATSLLKDAIRLRPDFAEAHYQLGKLYVEKNDTQKAIVHLETASQADKTKEYIYYQLSIAYRRASRLADSDKALKTYQELKAVSRKSESAAPMGSRNSSPQ